MTIITSLMIDEAQLQSVCIDEEAFLTKIYPALGNDELVRWQKRTFICEHGVEWNQYVAELDSGDGNVIIEIPRAGHR